MLFAILGVLGVGVPGLLLGARGVPDVGVPSVGVPGVLLGVRTAGCDRRGCSRCRCPRSVAGCAYCWVFQTWVF